MYFLKKGQKFRTWVVPPPLIRAMLLLMSSLSQAAGSGEIRQALKNKMIPAKDSDGAKDNEILGLNRKRPGEKWAPIPGIWRREKLQTFISEVGKLFRVTHRSGRGSKRKTL